VGVDGGEDDAEDDTYGYAGQGEQYGLGRELVREGSGVPGQLVSILLPLAPTTYQSAPNALDPWPLAVPAPVSAVK
jgi:hypothetical protein